MVVDAWVADRILAELDQHVAGVYEEICAQAVREGILDGLAPGCYRKAGRWWDRSFGWLYEIDTETRLPILLPR